MNAALLRAAEYAAAVLLVLGLAAALRRRLAPFPAAVLVLLPLLFCAPGFFGSRTLFPTDHVRQIPPWAAAGPGAAAPRRHNPNLNDAVTQIAPWTQAVRLAWREGSLPWNDRWNGCGTPLAANGQSGAFSPFTLLLFPLPLADAFTVGAAVRLLLALSGTFLWMREMEVSTPAALFAAVSFAFSMTMTPWLLFPLSAVFCLWPWALFAVELALNPAPAAGGEGGGTPRRGAVALTAVLACWVLAGHPESAALGGAAIAIFLAARLLMRERAPGRAGLLRIAGAAAAAAALAAFLWVPQAFAVRASNRLVLARQVRQALPASVVPHAPAWPAGFLMPAFPRLFGDDVAAPLAAGAASSFPEMAMPYFGAIGAALALLLAFPGARRDRRALAAAAVAGAGLLVGSGTWPFFDAFVGSPVLGLVSPLRPLSWVALMGSAIAGFELDRLRRSFAAGRGRRFAVVAAPAVVAAAAAAAFLRARAAAPLSGGTPGGPREALAGALAAAVIPLAVLAAFLLVWRVRPRFAAGAALGLAAAAGAELFVQGERLYSWGDPRDAFPETPLTRFLAGRQRPFRIVGADAALFPNTNVFAGAEDIRVHDAVERRAYVNLLDREAGYPPGEYFKRIANLEAPLLDFLNVRYLVTSERSRLSTPRWTRVYDGPDGGVFESPSARPRVFSRSLEISEYSDTANTVAFRIRNGSGQAAVAVASVVQDGGWSARDERNNAVPSEVASAMFVALRVPPGDHRIRLEYTPPGLRQGVGISAAGAAILALDAMRRRRFSRRRLKRAA